MEDRDDYFMGLALQCAREAEKSGEVPVGAVIVANEHVLAMGSNAPIGLSDPTAHAEIQALRAASAELENYRLPGVALYVTLEPCAMCAGAIVHARVERLIFGCTDPRGGAAGSVFNIVDSATLNHRVQVTGGVRENECRDLLQSFFRARRA